MAALPAPILPRVASLLRLLGSPIDGEALGAARALGRTLQGAGVDWHALAEAVERPAVVLRDAPQPAPQRRGRKPRAAAPESVEIDPLQRRRVIDTLGRAGARGALSAWEAAFCASVIDTLRGSRPRLSVRQIEIVEQLLSKFGESLF